MSWEKSWGPEEYASKTVEEGQEHIERILKQGRDLSETYALKEESHPAYASLRYAFEKLQDDTEKGFGYGLKGLGKMGMVADHWASDDAVQFRYNTLPFFHGYATFLNSFFNNLPNFAEGSSPKHFMLKVALDTAEEANKQYPWARANPDKVESWTKNTIMDPMLYTSFLEHGMLGVAEKLEVSRLLPIAKAMMEAGSAPKIITLGKPLWGADPAISTFASSISDLTKAGQSPEYVAKFMYAQGARTSDWAKVSSLPLSDWFKRGENIASPSMIDRIEAAFGSSKARTLNELLGMRNPKAAELKSLVSAMKEEYQLALSKLPGLTKDEMELVDWAEHNIPRSQYNPVPSFTNNYAKAVAKGEAPAVDPELMDKMKAYIGTLSSGWREGSAWRSAYGTGLRDAQRINLGLKPASEIEGLVDRPWRLEQKYEGQIKALDNFQKWHAQVATRERFADMAATHLKNAEDYANSLTPGLSKELANQYVSDLRQYIASPDFIKYRATDTANAVFAAYDSMVSLMKTGMLKFSPGFYVHRFTDMAMARSLAMTGETHILGTLKAALTGEAEPIRDIFGQTYHAGARLEDALGLVGKDSVIGSIDQETVNHFARSAYNKTINTLKASGLSAKNMDALAKKASLEAADLAHGIYKTSSKASQFFDRTHFFWRHYVGRMAFWATQALESPGEYYGLSRLREYQQDYSVDRQGSIAFPGVGVLWDPLRRITLPQVMEAAINPTYFLRPEESAAYIPARVVHAIMGEWTQPLSSGLEKAEAIPAQGDRPLADIENLVGMAVKAVTGEKVLPSDPFLPYLGHNPQESRADYEERKTQLFVHAAEQAGQPISRPEAQQQAESATNKAQFLSWGSGQTLVPYRSGMEFVLGAQQDFRETMLRTPPAERYDMRRVWLAQPGHEGMDKIIPLDPPTYFKANSDRLENDKARTESMINSPETPTESTRRKSQGEDLLDTLRKTPYGNLFESIYNRLVPPAGAEEIHQNPDHPDKPVEWRKTSYGPVPASTPGNFEEMQQARKHLKDYDDFKIATKDMVNEKQIHDYAAQSVVITPDGRHFNPILDMLQRTATIDADAAFKLSAYNYVESGGTTPLRGNISIGMGKATTDFSRSFSAFMNSSKPGDWGLATGSKEDLMKAYASGRIPLPEGYKKDDISPYIAQKVLESFPSYALKGIKENWEKQAPGVDNALSELYYATKQDQYGRKPDYQTAAAIENIQQAVQNKTVDPSVWEHIKDAHPQLYGTIAMYQNKARLDDVTKLFTVFDSTGHVYKVDPDLLLHAVKNGLGPEVGMILATSSDPKMRSELDNAIEFNNSLFKSHGVDLDLRKSIGGDIQTLSTFVHGLDVQLGLSHPWYLDPAFHATGTSPEVQSRAQDQEIERRNTLGDFKTEFKPNVSETAKDLTPISDLANKPPPSPQGEMIAKDFTPQGIGSTAKPPSMPMPIGDRTPAPIHGEGLIRSTAEMHTDIANEANAQIMRRAVDTNTMPVPDAPLMTMRSMPYTPVELVATSLGVWSNADVVQRRLGISDIAAPVQFGSALLPQKSVVTPQGTPGVAGTPGASGPGGVEVGVTPEAKLAQQQKMQGEAAGLAALANIGVRLAGSSPNSPEARAAGGFQTAVSATAAITAASGGTLAPIAPFVGAAAGIYQGLTGSKGHTNYQDTDEYKARQAQQVAQYAEHAASTNAMGLQRREQDLAKMATVGRSPMAGPQLQDLTQRINAYRRYPTFASRIGLVDTIERSMSSAMVPRW